MQEHVKLQSLEDITSYLKFMAENRNKVKLQDTAINKDENEHIKNWDLCQYLVHENSNLFKLHSKL